MTPPLADRMRAELRTAMQARDRAAVSALRSALAAIANAEAQPPAAVGGMPPAGPGDTATIAGSVAGLGAAESARREVSPAEARALVLAELHDAEAGAVHAAAAGEHDRAAQLRAGAGSLRRVLTEE